MKKMLTLIFSALLLVSMVACNNSATTTNDGNDTTVHNDDTIVEKDSTVKNDESTPTTDNGGDKKQETDTAPTKQIRVEDIVFSSPFHEGLAFVAIKDDPYTAYCINKSGEPIFKIENCSQDNTERGVIELGLNFNNGLMLFDGNIYDKSGKVITPASLGATNFIKWDGTYLLSEKITSDYDSAIKELGVLNKDFEWELPLSEALYTIYKEDASSFYDLLTLSEAERNARISIIGDSVYVGFEKRFSTTEVGATHFKEIWDNRYVVAAAKGSWGMSDNIGILSLDGEWFAAPNSYLKILYEENPTWFKNEIIAEEPRDRNCLFADSYIFVNDGTVITAEDLNVESILEANNDYILVRVSGEAHYPAVGVMDYNGNWVVNPSGDNYDSYRACDNIYFSGHYMVMNMDDVLYYYDLTSNIILEEKPDDLPEQEQPPKDDDDANVNDKIYDITQIKNYRMGTEFINGKAAVLLSNWATGELFISVVDQNFDFLFEPKKLGILLSDCNYPLLQFDGEYVIFYDTYSGTAEYPLKLYAYNTNGEEVISMSTSIFEIDSTTSISCDYNEGVFVFSFNYGTYSAYYRQSTVKYYSIDGTPFEW